MNTSTFTSFCLKIAGLIFILSFLLDAGIFAYPFNWQDSSWRINFITAIVDRGIVPMVGMVFIIVGYWIDGTLRDTTSKQSGTIKLITFILAVILGLLFLLMIPLHINNINQVKTTTLETIQKSASQGEEQIQSFLAQLNNLSKNPQLLDQEIQQRTQVIESGVFQGQQLTVQQLETLRSQRDQLTNLRNLAKNPKEFTKRIDEIKNQLQTELADRKRQAESQANREALKNALRIGLSSLMLAIGYSAIGWLGIRGLGDTKKRLT